ncbi:MAG TPA: lysophospholipid acyltransferase family protein [Candidatus Limnocylindria bacterium]|jgi:1-acyl-sn-glycerol-3-phosphate acyltransferase|nr:lysophospholipid acyltransferase family protein [Candidatus Limnocylindria bacterium]
MDAATDRRRRTGPREISVAPDGRYRALWTGNRLLVRLLYDVRAEGLERWPEAPFCLALNHHNGWDPMLVMAVSPFAPRITWFGPKEADFSRGFKNRVMAFFGGVIPYDPDKTTLTSAVRAVRRVFAAGGVLGIFAEGRIGFRETQLLPFEEGAVAFAATAGVPIVPGVVVGSSYLWFRRTVIVRFAEPIPTRGERSAAARDALAERVRAAMRALLPAAEPTLPRRRPLQVIGDMLSGREALARRRQERGE